MNDLRTAAQQALEALKGYRRELGDRQPCDAEQALEAALAEPVECSHGECFGGECIYTYQSQRPAEPQGCDHCSHPMYAGIKCRLCGKVTAPAPPPDAQTEAEKIAYCAGWWAALEKARKAEPVEWSHINGTSDTKWHPPQRKPVEWDGRCMLGHCNSPAGCENSGECRAVERAHGIKE